MATSTWVGTVTQVPTGGFLTVSTAEGAPVRAAAARNLGSVAVGDQVLVTVDARQVWVTAVLGVAPAPQPPPPVEIETKPIVPPEQRTLVTGTDTVLPSWSGSHRGGAWRAGVDDLYQGTWTSQPANRGAAAYGSLDAYGTLTAVVAQLRRLAGGVTAAQTPTMLLLAPGLKTGGFPTVLAQTAGPAIAVGGTAAWTLPAGWVSQLSAGTAGGMGIGTGATTPYVHLAPPALDVSWERTT